LPQGGFFEKIGQLTCGTIVNMRMPKKATFGARKDIRGAPKIRQQGVEQLRETGYSDSEFGRLLTDRVIVDGRLER
jgi:hypothetical protein